MVDAIVIENDEKYETAEFRGCVMISGKSHKRGNYSQNQRGRRSRYGRSRFPLPTIQKETDKIEYVLVNGAEPDYRRMLEQPGGLSMVCLCFLELLY